MYDYGYSDYGYSDYGYAANEVVNNSVAGFGVALIFTWLITMSICVYMIIVNWKVFKKAGQPGWAVIVPIYNIIVMLKIAGLPEWYILLYFVPFANIYVMFKLNIELAHKFGKSTGFGIGLVFLSPIFLSILAFDKNVTYGGQTVAQAAYQQPVYQQQAQPSYQQPMNQQPVQPTQPTINQNVTPTVCPNCGSPLMANAKFCTRCGKQM